MFFYFAGLLLQELQCHFHQQLLVVAWHHHTPRHTYLLLPLSFNFFVSLVLLLLFYGFTIVITVALRLRFGFGFFSIFYFRKFFHYIFRLPFCPSPSLTLATKCCHNRYCVCCFIYLIYLACFVLLSTIFVRVCIELSVSAPLLRFEMYQGAQTYIHLCPPYTLLVIFHVCAPPEHDITAIKHSQKQLLYKCSLKLLRHSTLTFAS